MNLFFCFCFFVVVVVVVVLFFFFFAPYAALIRVSRVNLVEFSLWLLLMELTVLSICGPIFHEVLKEFLYLSQ